MSIILKALKKAETASGKQAATSMQAYSSASRGKWPFVIVAACTVVLGFFFAAYLFKGPNPVKTQSSAKNTGATAAPKVTIPAGASALNAKAIALIRAGQHNEAESLLMDAVKKHPNDPYLHNHLALALKKQSKLEEAESEYRKAIELKSDYYIAMNNLAVTLEAMGQKERAREMYEEALEGDPSVSGAHLNYALLLEAEGKINAAEDHYHTFMALSKDSNLRSLVRRRLLALK
jgi:Flp pilus assembly protein TadD